MLDWSKYPAKYLDRLVRAPAHSKPLYSIQHQLEPNCALEAAACAPYQATTACKSRSRSAQSKLALLHVQPALAVLLLTIIVEQAPLVRHAS